MTQPAQCGTRSGYVTHRKRREVACDACKTAEREYQQEWRARGGVMQHHTRSVTVPKMLLAEMYLNAPFELQERIEKELGQRRIDTLVRQFDAQGASA